VVGDPWTYSRPTGSVHRRRARVRTNARNWFDTSDPSASSRGSSVHVNARICRRGCVKGQGYLATWLPGYLARLGAVAVVAVDVFCRVVTTVIAAWPHDRTHGTMTAKLNGNQVRTPEDLQRAASGADCEQPQGRPDAG